MYSGPCGSYFGLLSSQSFHLAFSGVFSVGICLNIIPASKINIIKSEKILFGKIKMVIFFLLIWMQKEMRWNFLPYIIMIEKKTSRIYPLNLMSICSTLIHFSKAMASGRNGISGSGLFYTSTQTLTIVHIYIRTHWTLEVNWANFPTKVKNGNIFLPSE